jgi:hypothetical protein
MTPPELQTKEAENMTPPQVQSKPLVPWFKQLKVPRLKPEPLLICGALLAAIGLTLTQPNLEPPTRELDPTQFCQEIVEPKATVSREQLAKLLAIPERGSRSQVQVIVKEPYCRMPNLSIRAGAITERVAYPLASDPQTWLVILYEGKTYVGYGFKRP